MLRRNCDFKGEEWRGEREREMGMCKIEKGRILQHLAWRLERNLAFFLGRLDRIWRKNGERMIP
jgi:hypothetical protein